MYKKIAARQHRQDTIPIIPYKLQQRKMTDITSNIFYHISLAYWLYLF